jgi:RNA polymerase sigma-70 factor (ECF subfamily)
MREKDTISILTIVALRTGDEHAFESVYEHFSERLYGHLLKLVKSKDIAQELLQEIFLKVWEKRHSIDPEKSFRSYLFSIAENLAYDFFRKAARDKKLQVYLLTQATEAYSYVEENAFNNEYTGLLQKAINALPPRRRQIFQLCKLEGKSYEEAALQLGISTSTISDHIVKATRTIREYFNTHPELLLAVSLCATFCRFMNP